MKTMFTSGKNNIKEFLRMARLLDFLETSNDKAQKINEIKAARDSGFISESEALELACEFC